MTVLHDDLHDWWQSLCDRPDVNIHAKFHDFFQVMSSSMVLFKAMSSCHVFAIWWEFAMNSHFYKVYHECKAFGLHRSSCDAGHLATVNCREFGISMWFCMSLELELEMELESEFLSESYCFTIYHRKTSKSWWRNGFCRVFLLVTQNVPDGLFFQSHLTPTL